MKIEEILRMEISKNWDNVEDLIGFVVEEGDHGFAGRLVDENKNTISILGMYAHNIGFSYDKEKTTEITKKNFYEVWDVARDKEI